MVKILLIIFPDLRLQAIGIADPKISALAIAAVAAAALYWHLSHRDWRVLN